MAFSPSFTANVTVTEEGKEDMGAEGWGGVGWMHLPRFHMAAPAHCDSRSSYDGTDLSFLQLFFSVHPLQNDCMFLLLL